MIERMDSILVNPPDDIRDYKHHKEQLNFKIKTSQKNLILDKDSRIKILTKGLTLVASSNWYEYSPSDIIRVFIFCESLFNTSN